MLDWGVNFPCPTKVDCPCTDDVIQNFSAEPPDKRIFFPEVPYGWPRSLPPLPPWNGFYPDCAADSQEKADLCAARPPNNGFPEVAKIFGNQPQTCSVACPNGSTATYTVAANTFFAFTQAAANAMAANLACASASPSCGEVLFKNSAQSCTVNCSGGGTSNYITPANYFTALTQAEANAQAASLACEIASQQCSSPVTIFFNTAQTCVVACETGSATYTVAAGLIAGTSQANANAGAMTLACQAATLLCASVPQIFTNSPQTCTSCAGATYTTRAGAFSATDQSTADLLAYLFACSMSQAVCNNAVPPDTINHQPMFYNTPQSCEIACIGGTFRYTVYGRTFSGTTLAEANAAAQSFACHKAAELAVCLPAIAASACLNTLYSASVTISGATAYAISAGTLPPGISLSGSTLIGIPSTDGTYNFTVTASRPDGSVGSRSYTIRVAGITGASTPNGTVNAAYAGSVTESGMVNPVWSVTSGMLPPGLSLDPATGVIAGTPTVEGTFTFTVQVSD